MKNQTIESKVLTTELIEWQSLKFIQQENFKEWTPQGDLKLQASLLKYQFIDPFKVWENNGDQYCLDGYHRYKDLLHLKESGVDVPDKLPATMIACEDMTEAAELVLVYSSQYAKITNQGLFDFVSQYEIDIDSINKSINIPEFSMPRFEQQFDLIDVENAEEDHVYLDDDVIIVGAGDLFEINDHRIVCGSFKDSEAVGLLMQDSKKARIINCDPPYNLPANFFTNKESKKHEDFAEAAGEMSDDEFVKFLTMIMQTSVDNSMPGAIHYIFMDFRHCWHMTEAARKVYNNPQPKQVCVWNKDMMANGSFYRAKHELCFVFSDERAKALWNKDMLDYGGEFYKDNNEWCYIFKHDDKAKHLSHLQLKDRIRSNVWNYPSAISRANPDRFQLDNHPTPKPVVMIADAILDTTNSGDVVIDWFLGSGTALIACEHTHRIGRFTEIEPKFVQCSIIRYLNYCSKRNINVKFTHLNGSLTLKDFSDVQQRIQSSN